MNKYEKLSKHYEVKELTTHDSDEIFLLCKENKEYYKHFFNDITKDGVIDDLFEIPIIINKDDKHVLGFYDNCQLIAILDLVDKYPNDNTLYIGLFMLDVDYQNKGIGTMIINDLVDYATNNNYKGIRLAWIIENDKAKNFWMKNGFYPLGEKITKNKKPIKVTEATRLL